jgi:4-diphosphocytidyl-2-C-methyl-D-erythritol kinase
MNAYAKVNLFLNVTGLRPDGYHLLEMINAKIDLADQIQFQEIQDHRSVVIRSNDPFLEQEDTLLYDVAKSLMSYYAPSRSVEIIVQKNIPPGAGLAGNSTDAATIIKGLNQLFSMGMNALEMESWALKFGADIPYCLYDYPALVRGIGEKIEPIKLPIESDQIIIVKPKAFVDTPRVFKEGDRQGFMAMDSSLIHQAIETNNRELFIAEMKNALEPITFSLSPETAKTKALMVNYLGAKGVVMSGSGSSIIKVYQGMLVNLDAFINTYHQKYDIFLTKFMIKE